MPTHDAIQKKHDKERKKLDEQVQKGNQKILQTQEVINNLETLNTKTLNKKKHK